MKTVTSVAQLREALAATASQRVGFVPTMGALHAGHQALFRAAKAQCDIVVVSIFVNPTQFRPSEDFLSYPRTPEADESRAEACGVDVVWCPEANEIYPPAESVRVSVGPMGDRLCGAYRPGHFDGVATVVVKLLNAVQPNVLYLGEKDYQQVVILRRVAADLLFDTEIRTVATVRDPDGLALSSRNTNLDQNQRKAALCLSRALNRTAEAAALGEQSIGRLRAITEIEIACDPLVSPQYVEFVDPETLEPVETLDRPVLLAVAAYVGSTRLIDNRLLYPST